MQLSLSTTWRAGTHSRVQVYCIPQLCTRDSSRTNGGGKTPYKEAHTARFMVYREANLIRSSVNETARRHTRKPNKTLSEAPLFEWMEYCGRASGYTINTRPATEECRRQPPGNAYSTAYIGVVFQTNRGGAKQGTSQSSARPRDTFRLPRKDKHKPNSHLYCSRDNKHCKALAGTFDRIEREPMAES